MIALIALAAAPVLGAQTGSYTCKDGRVVATASSCGKHFGKMKHKGHRRHHRKMTTTISNGTVVSPKVEPAKPSLPQKAAHGVGEAGGDVSKLGKKAMHGIGEAAGDVKKVFTKKP